MDGDTESYKRIKLTKLLETSLGAPEPGCVNFNLLRLLLSTIISRLKIEDVEAEVDDEILNRTDTTSTFRTNREDGLGTIQDRLRTLESQMENLNSLPNSRELLEKIFPSSTDTGHVEAQANPDQRRVSELWQTVQMKRRVDATEEGLSRLSSLTDDLLNQIKRLSDENKRLSSALEEAKKGADLNDKLMDLERKLLELEKRRLQDASLLKNVVHMDALRGLVFWHSLGAAVTGIDYLTAYANATDKVVTNEKSLDENKSDNGLVNKWPENKLACPDPDLSFTLRKLGTVASGYDSVLQRIDRLENKKLITTMQDTLAVLQKQIVQMHQLITATQAEMKSVREQFADLQQFAEDMDTRKLDAAQMDAELLKASNVNGWMGICKLNPHACLDVNNSKFSCHRILNIDIHANEIGLSDSTEWHSAHLEANSEISGPRDRKLCCSIWRTGVKSGVCLL